MPSAGVICSGSAFGIGMRCGSTLVNSNAALRAYQKGVSLATPDAGLVGILIKKMLVDNVREGTIQSFSPRQSSVDDDVVRSRLLGNIRS